MAEQSQNLLNFGNKQENNGADSQGRLTAYEFNQVIDAINNNSNDVFDLHNKTKDLENVDNTKKNKDYVIQANIFNESLTINGVEYPLVDVDWETLSNVILSNECDIVFVDFRGERYKLDHVWLSDGMPYGYKLLDGNRRLNIATVTDSEGNLKVIYKFNEGAVTYDNLGGVKPLVIGLKLGDDGQPIEDIGLSNDETAAFESDVTFEQVKAAYDAKRPIYVDFSKWEDGAVMFNLVPVQQILSIGGSNAHLQGVATISNYDGGAIIVSFYAVNDGENPAKVSILLGSNPWDYNELKDKPTINGVELSGGSLLNSAEELDLCRKPLVLQFKLDADGNKIPVEGSNPPSYVVEGATYMEIKMAYQLHRPLYFSYNATSNIDSFSQITAGLIPLTYRFSDGGFLDEYPCFFANGIDGFADAVSNTCDYTIVGNFINDSGEITSAQGGGKWTMSVFYSLTHEYYSILNKPQINGVELVGNKTSKDLKLQGALRTSADLTLSSDDVLSLTDMAKKRLFIDLWNECAVDFGRYNEETGYFELNGITDLTWNDALIIFELSAYRDYPDYATGDFCRGVNLKTNGKFRTNLAPIMGGYLHKSSAYQIRTYMCNQLEVLNVMQRMPFNRPPFVTRPMSTSTNHIDLYNSGSLRKIMGVVYLYMSGAVTYGYGLPNLEEINLYNITQNYKYMYNAPKLNYTSVKTMIEQRGGTNAITIWYHADVYNKILGTADDAAYASSGGTKEEWMSLADLAAGKNITLATE